MTTPIMTTTTTSSRYCDDDDSSTGSLLVSPTKTIETSICWGDESAETTANQSQMKMNNNNNFKNSNGDGDGDHTDNTRTAMDVTFQDSIDMPHKEEQEGDESLLFETDAANEDAVTPAKHRFSYAAAMEQLDDSWLAPTPKRPNNHCDDSLDLAMEDQEEEEKVEDVGTCLEEQFSESPVQEESLLEQDDILDEMPDDESTANVKNNQDEHNDALYSSSLEEADAPLVPALKHSPTSASKTTAPLNNQVLSPNIDSSGDEADTTSAIFRHPSIPHNHQQQQEVATSSNMMMTLQHGHPVNESYDSVEQRKLHLEQETNGISSFLVDRDRVENDIVLGKNPAGGDESMVDEGDGVEKNDYGLDTLNEEEHVDEENDEQNETELSLDDEDEEERVFKNAVLDTLEEHVDEAKMTLTQTADGTTDSDGFLKKIENAENDEGVDDVVVRSYEETVDGNGVLDKESDLVEKEDYCDESEGELNLTNASEEVADDRDVSLIDGDYALGEHDQNEGNEEDATKSVPELNPTYPEPQTEGVFKHIDKNEEQKDDNTSVTAHEHNPSSPTVSSAQENDLQASSSPAIDSSETGGGSNPKGEGIILDKSDLASSTGNSLAFSTSADSDDNMLELSQQAQNTSQSKETGNIKDVNVCPTPAALEGNDVGNDNVEFNASIHSSSEVEAAGTDLSFDGNCLSASLDVSLSNIDREELFAGSFSQQLSPIRQNSSSPHDLSQRHDDELNGDEIQLPATSATSSVSGSLSPRDSTTLAGGERLDESSSDPVANECDNLAVATGGSLEGSPTASPTTGNTEINKGSIFAVLSQVNTGVSSNNAGMQDEPPMNENASDHEEKEVLISGPSGDGISEENFTDDTRLEVMDVQKSNVETSDKHFENPVDDALDEKNKSLEDLSSYQQSFNSTSSAFLERLRVAAESRKREVTKARFSMERKEQILYEKREDREVMPTVSEMADEVVDEPTKATVTKTLVKPFMARPLPSAETSSEPTSQLQHPRSTSTIGSKRKSTNALRPMHDNKPYDTDSMKPPKRLLSGEDASKAKEMTRRRLLEEEDERMRRESVFRARPLPASTLPRTTGRLEQQPRRSHNKAARAGKENSAFKPSSTARAEARAAYNAKKKVQEEERRQEQIRKRNARIHETNEEIEKLKRSLR